MISSHAGIIDTFKTIAVIGTAFVNYVIINDHHEVRSLRQSCNKVNKIKANKN